MLKLKENGIKTPMAGQIADFARDGVRGVTAILNWDSGFDPFMGRFETDRRWFLDIGDLTYVRVVTDAKPSPQELLEYPWCLIGHRNKQAEATPIVIIRLDMTQLATLLSR